MGRTSAHSAVSNSQAPVLTTHAAVSGMCLLDLCNESCFLQVYTDSHVSTKYHWARPHVLSPESTATITWDIPEGIPSGQAGQTGWLQPLLVELNILHLCMSLQSCHACMRRVATSSGRMGVN